MESTEKKKYESVTQDLHLPPEMECILQIKNFYEDIKIKENELKPKELAAWTHAEFVRIPPYIDGNGRTSRLIMNYQLF